MMSFLALKVPFKLLHSINAIEPTVRNEFDTPGLSHLYSYKDYFGFAIMEVHVQGQKSTCWFSRSPNPSRPSQAAVRTI